jgi:hypothetical protein
MNMLGFNAESSLGPTIGIYRGKALSGGLGTGEVLPMQEILSLIGTKSESDFFGAFQNAGRPSLVLLNKTERKGVTS